MNWLGFGKNEPSSHFELLYPTTYQPINLETHARLPQNLQLNHVQVGPLGRHWWSTGLPRFLRNSDIDLFHGTNYDVPLWRTRPTVLTIHDLSQLLYPETHLKRSVNRARRRLPVMARTADAIIRLQSVAGKGRALNKIREVFAIRTARECFVTRFAELKLSPRLKVRTT